VQISNLINIKTEACTQYYTNIKGGGGIPGTVKDNSIENEKLAREVFSKTLIFYF
jgi:hypothetical protein